MAKYEKWLGAGLGFVVGGPIGGLLGFITGSMLERGQGDAKEISQNISEFEVNLMVLASHFIKIDGRVSMSEIQFTEQFLNTHFDPSQATERRQILNHCLQKEYDLDVACGQIRMNTSHSTKVQVVRFLMDLALCDGELSEREHYFIFKIAGFLNVNDVEYRRIRNEHTNEGQAYNGGYTSTSTSYSYYRTLEVSETATYEEIRASYRKLVLKYHPDRNKDASEVERKKLAAKFQQIQEAYDILKAQKGGR